MDLEAMYAGKAEMFRAAIDKQADEEIARAVKAINARKAANDKEKSKRELAEALAQIHAEESAAAAKFKKEFSRCDFETTKAVRAHRKELIEKFFEEIESELREFVKSAGYKDYIKRSLKKADDELGGGVILANPDDADKVRALTSNEVRAENSILIGGICAVDEKRGLFADYTLDKALADEKEAFSDKSELRL